MCGGGATARSSDGHCSPAVDHQIAPVLFYSIMIENLPFQKQFRVRIYMMMMMMMMMMIRI
jgi:hypothetical protein